MTAPGSIPVEWIKIGVSYDNGHAWSPALKVLARIAKDGETISTAEAEQLGLTAAAAEIMIRAAAASGPMSWHADALRHLIAGSCIIEGLEMIDRAIAADMGLHGSTGEGAFEFAWREAANDLLSRAEARRQNAALKIAAE